MSSEEERQAIKETIKTQAMYYRKKVSQIRTLYGEPFDVNDPDAFILAVAAVAKNDAKEHQSTILKIVSGNL